MDDFSEFFVRHRTPEATGGRRPGAGRPPAAIAMAGPDVGRIVECRGCGNEDLPPAGHPCPKCHTTARDAHPARHARLGAQPLAWGEMGELTRPGRPSAAAAAAAARARAAANSGT